MKDKYTNGCPKCSGKGYWGTFGACDLHSIHKKIKCPACKGSGELNNNLVACKRCSGKGYWGAFGACEWHSIHKEKICPICKGDCYLMSDSKASNIIRDFFTLMMGDRKE